MPHEDRAPWGWLPNKMPHFLVFVPGDLDLWPRHSNLARLLYSAANHQVSSSYGYSFRGYHVVRQTDALKTSTSLHYARPVGNYLLAEQLEMFFFACWWKLVLRFCSNCQDSTQIECFAACLWHLSFFGSEKNNSVDCAWMHYVVEVIVYTLYWVYFVGGLWYPESRRFQLWIINSSVKMLI